MKAAVYESFKGKISIQNVPDPTPSSHGVVVKVNATGMCLSDWHGWQGHDADIELPHVPGHELAGEIVEIGKEIQNFKIGDRVTIPFVAGCGHCVQCESGNHQVCDHQSQPGFTHWGSFAEYTRLDYADVNLVKLPESISSETASILGCRFITSFRAVAHQGSVKQEEYLVVHGCGGVGLSAIMIGKALGAQVIAVDINRDALSMARSLGALETINSLESPNTIEEIKELTKGGAHVSVDAIGHPETCFNSISNLRKRGRHVQIGLMAGDHQHPKTPMDQVIANELEIYGSHGMQAFKYPEMLQLIHDGKLSPEKLIERKIPLKESVDLLPRMDEFKSSGVTVINDFYHI